MVNTFELSSRYYDFALENPDKVKPIHGCLYHFIIHLNNKLGWREKIGLPTYNAMSACGVKNVRTYTNALDDLINWGFVIMIQKCKNQYTSNIIALVKNNEAHDKAPYKANAKHHTKQMQSTVTIDKPIKYKTNKQENRETENSLSYFPADNFETLLEQYFIQKKVFINTTSREAIVKLGQILAFKTESKDPVYNSDLFIRMYENLESDEWWKVKRRDLRYLSENFEEAYQVATNKKTTKVKELNYSKSKYVANGK